MKKIKIGIFWSLFVGIQIVISIGLIYTLLIVPKTRTSGIEYNDDLELEATDPLVEKEDIFTQYFTPKYKYVNTIDTNDTELWEKEIPLTTVKNFIYVDLDVKKELKTDEIYALNI